jgi:hypothetical protein
MIFSGSSIFFKTLLTLALATRANRSNMLSYKLVDETIRWVDDVGGVTKKACEVVVIVKARHTAVVTEKRVMMIEEFFFLFVCCDFDFCGVDPKNSKEIWRR